MALEEALLNIYTRFVDQNYGESDENMCGKCCKMKHHLELLINELKPSQLIIKILQDEIKSTSNGPKNQDNLTNSAEYKSHDESHPTIDKNSAWKEIRLTRTMAMKHKRYKNTDQRVTDTFPLSLNRYDPLCNVSEGDNTLASTGKSKMAESKQIRKHKMDCKKRGGRRQHKVIILGDSHARGCASEVSRLLNNEFEVLGFVNPGAGMKYTKDTSRVKVQQLTKKDVVVLYWGGVLMTL